MDFERQSDSLLVEFVCIFLALSGTFHSLDGLIAVWLAWGGPTSNVMYGILSSILGTVLVLSSIGLLFRGGSNWLVGASSIIVFLILLDILGLIMFGAVALALDFVLLVVGLTVLVKHYSASSSVRSGLDRDENVHSVGRDYP